MATTNRLATDDRVLAGAVLALIGGLLALIPELERLLAGTPAWPEALIMALVAGVASGGALLGLRDRPMQAAFLAGVAGVLIAVLGPTAPGVLCIVGAVVLYVTARSDAPASDRAAADTSSSTVR